MHTLNHISMDIYDTYIDACLYLNYPYTHAHLHMYVNTYIHLTTYDMTMFFIFRLFGDDMGRQQEAKSQWKEHGTTKYVAAIVVVVGVVVAVEVLVPVAAGTAAGKQRQFVIKA